MSLYKGRFGSENFFIIFEFMEDIIIKRNVLSMSFSGGHTAYFHNGMQKHDIHCLLTEKW